MSSEKGPTAQGRHRARARPLSELLRALASDAAELVRREIALARAEIRNAVRIAVAAASRVAVGAGLAGMGLLTILAGVVVLIGSLIGSYWASALIVGGLLVAAGAVSAFAGVRRMRSVDPAPRRAIESVRETARWGKAEVAELRAGLLGRPRHTVEAPQRGAATASPSLRYGSVAAPRRDVSAGSRASAVIRAPSAAVDRIGDHALPVPDRRAPKPPPPRELGTLAFLKHVGREIQEDEITGHAAKLAYYSFLAMPPALMALFGLAGLVGSAQVAAWIEEQAALALPAAVFEDIVRPFIQQVVLSKAPGPFSIGLLLALWGGSALFAGLIETLNHAYDIEETRPFLRKRLLAVVTMLASTLLFLGAAGSLLVAPELVDMLGLGRVGTIVWNLAQWPVAFAFMVTAFWGAYYFLPNRDQRGSRWVLVRAAAIAAALWVLATAGFRLYIANFSSYSETYGFLGAFIILLLWLYVTGLVVLAGGELASEMEKRAS